MRILSVIVVMCRITVSCSKYHSRDKTRMWLKRSDWSVGCVVAVCAAAAVKVTEWSVGPQGLLYDRMWMVVNEHGVYLSQKREPMLCQIQPHISLASNALHIKAPGAAANTTPGCLAPAMASFTAETQSKRTCLVHIETRSTVTQLFRHDVCLTWSAVNVRKCLS